MRDQYAGDISDFLKYGLLRALAADDRKLGVAWYYNPENDGRSDGNHTEYIAESKWARVDAALHCALREFNEAGAARAVRKIQELDVWPRGTVFHGVDAGESVPVRRRADWFHTVVSRMSDRHLVFFDPDNGTRSLVGNASDLRYSSYDEIHRILSLGSSVLLIKFPGRVSFDLQQREYHCELKERTSAERLVTMRTSVMVESKTRRRVPRFRWFTLINADHQVEERFRRFATLLNEVPGVRAIVGGES